MDLSAIKNLINALCFLPKDNTIGIYEKKYSNCNYVISIDFNKKIIDYGNLIKSDSKTTQNFSQDENFVVLECVDRLLEKGYKPENIILEKTYPSGHGHSGRLDILINKNDKAFLMIECKTWGKEFEQELVSIYKDGGQLFTYFQNDKNSEYLMLYTSRLNGKDFEYRNEIIKIEEHYKTAGNVSDTYERWNKQTSSNGIFEKNINAYCYKKKPLTKKDLIQLDYEHSGKIFYGFLSILRKHSVSDKPNAFNKIFNLFLAKIYDEKKRDGDELDFQWIEERDNPVDFEVRLYNLHKAGLYEFLKKEIEGIADDDFNYKTKEELLARKKKLLKFNKVFDIKDVIDDESFDDNFRVLKEVVQLLEKYQIRYPRKQQHLSDFFERLLTTGLKQEAGQFFTPPPITKFITKSLPLDKIIISTVNQPVPKLPAVIDYAAGSGHFVTEIMESYQDCINDINTSDFYPEAISQVNSWKSMPYSWAGRYIYGIEKDYRLVKVAKVGCYFYGDGLAQIVHGDGLDNFEHSKSYVGLLKENIDDSSKAKFSIVVSNPPYSVDAFKGDIKNINVENDFDLYKYLTDRSSEIECLFVERTKQLLKEGGVAGIILPSSILTNSGIYTKTREILLKYFEIVGITELGSNTFMATGTNTVVLFLRRRNNSECINIKNLVDKFFENLTDVTINNIETPVKKYVDYVFENLAFEDYLTLLNKQPNENVKNHDIFKEYKQKIKSKNEDDFYNQVIEIEKEKLYYFILCYSQKVVIVKTGEKDKEKQFLGYEFSSRRGSEGIHPIQKSKTIEECTKLFDINTFENPQKASTYIYKAFNGNFDFEIDETLKENISRINLIDMMTFDRVDFEKVINVKSKKKVKIESKYPQVKIKDLSTDIINGSTPSTKVLEYWEPKEINWATIKDFTSLYVNNTEKFISKKGLDKVNLVPVNSVLLSCTATLGKVAINKIPLTTNQQINAIVCDNQILPCYLAYVLEIIGKNLKFLTSNPSVLHINQTVLGNIQIPLPPLEIQQKIVDEIEEIEKSVKSLNNKILNIKNKIEKISQVNCQAEKLENYADLLKRGKSPKYQDKSEIQIIKSGQIRGLNLFDFTNKYFASEAMLVDDRLLQKGDLLINSTGVGTAGRVNIFKLDGKYFVDSHVTILRLDGRKLLPLYALYQLYYNIGFKNIESMATGQSGQIELSIKTIANIKIPVPPIAEQQKIVSQIEELEQEINNAQQIIDESKNKKQQILDKYLK